MLEKNYLTIVSYYNNFFSINIQEVLVISKSGSEPIIDVRTPAELDQTGKIPGSYNIPVQDIKNVFENMPGDAFLEVYGFDKPELDEPFILTCRSGRRARRAEQILVNLGFTKIRVYDGSWNDWTAKNGPIEKVVDKTEEDWMYYE